MRRNGVDSLKDIVGFAKTNPIEFFEVYLYWMIGGILFVVSLTVWYFSNKDNFPDKDETKKNNISNNISENDIVNLKPWKCSSCEETIEAQFDVCWNCQSAKENTRV